MPELTNFYSNKILAELAVGYGGQGMIAGRVLPIVYSDDQSGDWQAFDDSNFVLDTDGAAVSPTSDVDYIDYSVTKSSFNCAGYGRKHFVPNAKSEDIAGQWLQGGVQAVMGQLLRIREKKALDLVLNCGNTSTISTKWDAASTDLGTVVTGVEAMKKTIRDATGGEGNVLIVGSDVWAVMAAHLANAYGLQPTAPTREVMAGVLGVEEVLVAGASYKTVAGGSASSFWTAKYAGLVVRGPSQPNPQGDLEANYFTPSFGKLVYWRNGGAIQGGVEWRMIDNPFKGSHGGVDVQGTLYFDALETLNDAATLGVALT